MTEPVGNETRYKSHHNRLETAYSIVSVGKNKIFFDWKIVSSLSQWQKVRASRVVRKKKIFRSFLSRQKINSP